MDAPIEVVAKLLKTLSDPTRLRIVQVLTMECDSVNQIVEITGLSQPLVSHHLRVLRENGLARAERRGPYTFYCLSDMAVWETIEHCGQVALRLQKNAQMTEPTSKIAV